MESKERKNRIDDIISLVKVLGKSNPPYKTEKEIRESLERFPQVYQDWIEVGKSNEIIFEVRQRKEGKWQLLGIQEIALKIQIEKYELDRENFREIEEVELEELIKSIKRISGEIGIKTLEMETYRVEKKIKSKETKERNKKWKEKLLSDEMEELMIDLDKYFEEREEANSLYDSLKIAYKQIRKDLKILEEIKDVEKYLGLKEWIDLKNQRLKVSMLAMLGELE
ncbi:MAG: hypothetical protein R2828_34390 [Saprospiraceae bacterium]